MIRRRADVIEDWRLQIADCRSTATGQAPVFNLQSSVFNLHSLYRVRHSRRSLIPNSACTAAIFALNRLASWG